MIGSDIFGDLRFERSDFRTVQKSSRVDHPACRLFQSVGISAVGFGKIQEFVVHEVEYFSVI